MNHINNMRFTIIVSGLELEQSSNADFTYSIGQRGCQQLVYERYTYVKNSVNRQRTIWKCSRKVRFFNKMKLFFLLRSKLDEIHFYGNKNIRFDSFVQKIIRHILYSIFNMLSRFVRLLKFLGESKMSSENHNRSYKWSNDDSKCQRNT